MITTEFTQPKYMLTTLFAMSYCQDGYHMAVAHSYCYELMIVYLQEEYKIM